jgi:hypothetical protein
MSNDAGKGDTYRPVNHQVYGENYDRIFRKGTHEHTADQAPDEAAYEACPRCGFSRCTAGQYTCTPADGQAADDGD